MKRIFIGTIAALLSALAFGTTYVPVQLLNPVGSTSGQVVLSNGPVTAPGWGNVAATSLAAQAANTVLANVSAVSASPTAFAMPSCNSSTSALQYTSGTGFTCYTNSASLAGATFTGSLGASYNSASFTLNDAGGTGFPVFFFNKAGTNVWALTNASSTGTLTLNRYVAGALTDSPISISNSTGAVTMSDGITNSPISGSTGSFTTLSSSGIASLGTGSTIATSPARGDSTSKAATTLFVQDTLLNPPAIGSGTAAAGKFTTLQATSTLTGFTGRLLNIQVFSSTGTYTPTTGTAAVYVKVQAGGGAGGGTPATSTGQSAAGSGGSAGTYAEGYYTSGFSGVTVTVGAAGASAVGANGGAGGASSFGALLSCPGGPGGVAGTASTAWTTSSGGNAGAVTGTNLYTVRGAQGSQSQVISATVSFSGAGAAAPFGSGGPGIWGPSAGLAGVGEGSGGGGANAAASTAAQAGSNGSPGLVEVFEFSQ